VKTKQTRSTRKNAVFFTFMSLHHNYKQNIKKGVDKEENVTKTHFNCRLAPFSIYQLELFCSSFFFSCFFFFLNSTERFYTVFWIWFDTNFDRARFATMQIGFEYRSSLSFNEKRRRTELNSYLFFIFH